MVNIRQQILNASDIRSEQVEIPEWGVTVEVRGFTLGERLAFYERVAPDGNINKTYFWPELVISCTYDPETGSPVFDAADRDTLQTKSPVAVDRIVDVARRLSGISSDEEAEQDLDETPADETS